MKVRTSLCIAAAGLACLACTTPEDPAPAAEEAVAGRSDIDRRLAKYTTVELTTDLSVLSDNQRQMIPLLIEAAQACELSKSEGERLVAAMPGLKPRAKTLVELANNAGFYVAARPIGLDEKAQKISKSKGNGR